MSPGPAPEADTLITSRMAKRGFTILLAALVASLVLALGISIFTIAQKQLILSSLGRGSQFAFYAADSGAECALYGDLRLRAFDEGATTTEITCAGQTVTLSTVVEYAQSSYNPLSSGPGSQSFSSSGTFTVPEYNTLTVECWGGGGGGGGDGTGQGNGSSGSASRFAAPTGTLTANGGAGGEYAGPGGPGGTATGGTTNTAGQAGGTRTSAASGKGGDSPNGGTGGASITSVAAGRAGQVPGGGGSGGRNSTAPGSGGGGGGYVARTYASGDLTVGSQIAVTVGTGGSGDSAAYSGGDGARGRCLMTWQ